MASQKVTACKGEISIDGRVISGCPQGGVISLLLWKLVVYELPDEIKGPDCKVARYQHHQVLMPNYPNGNNLENSRLSRDLLCED